MSLVRGLARFDGRSAFSTWVYRVATNAALDELRRRRRRPLASLDAHLAGDEGRPELDRHVRAPDASEAVVARIELDAALAELPDEQRTAVVLRDLCDLDYAEIAAVLEIPIGTVRSRIARGRAALARTLAPGTGLRRPDEEGNRGDVARRPSNQSP